MRQYAMLALLAHAVTCPAQPKTRQLSASFETAPQWDSVEKALWFFFYRDGMREYVSYNDARSSIERQSGGPRPLELPMCKETR